MGDFARSIGEGISGLVGGSIAAIGAGVATMVQQLQLWLPGPLFPIVLGCVAVLIVWWLLRK
jgi:hypothetical protein